MAHIHPTAIVDPQARLADDVDVGPSCVVQGPVDIGPGCRLIGQVYLNGPVTLGESNTLYPFVCVGFEPQHHGYRGGTAGVVIGDRNVFREMAVVHASMESDRPTRIGNDNFFMTNSHVGHDVHVTDRCTIASGALLAGYARLEPQIIMGGNSAIHQYCRVGRLAFMGGGATASRDVPPFMLCRHDDQVISLNVVGLRRSGVERAAIDAVRAAFRTLYLCNHTNPIAADLIEQSAQDGTPGADLLQELVDFIRTSRRGLCPFVKRHKRKHAVDAHDPSDTAAGWS